MFEVLTSDWVYPGGKGILYLFVRMFVVVMFWNGCQGWTRLDVGASQ